MKLEYSLTSSDFLEYQLYNSSKSKSTQKRLLRSRVLIPVIYIVIGLYFWYKDENLIRAILFGIIALLWFLFYPNYAKRRYKKHFKKHVAENYKNRINKTVEVFFDENHINTKDYTSESKINGTELKELIETENYFFIKLVTELCLIVPKIEVANQSELKKRVTDFGAEYLDETNWKW